MLVDSNFRSNNTHQKISVQLNIVKKFEARNFVGFQWQIKSN